LKQFRRAFLFLLLAPRSIERKMSLPPTF